MGDERRWTIPVCGECDELLDDCTCDPADYRDPESGAQGSPPSIEVTVSPVPSSAPDNRRAEGRHIADDPTDDAEAVTGSGKAGIQPAATSPSGPELRDAARVVVEAWQEQTPGVARLGPAIRKLHHALAASPAPGGPSEEAVTAARGEIGRYVCTDEASVHHGCVLGDPNGIADSVVLAIDGLPASRERQYDEHGNPLCFVCGKPQGAHEKGEECLPASPGEEQFGIVATANADWVSASKGEVEAVAREMRTFENVDAFTPPFPPQRIAQQIVDWADRLSPSRGAEEERDG